MVLHMMSYIYSHCRTEGRWLTGVNLQVRTSTLVYLKFYFIFSIPFSSRPVEKSSPLGTTLTDSADTGR
jgi:hypothetical protein